ncbi:MAG: SCP2 sterol-binding domain-containing protein [Actinomycetota bacterium]
MATLDEAFAAALTEASASVDPPMTRSAAVEFTIGKTQRLLLDVVDGRIVGAADDDREPDVSIPVTSDQLDGFVAGSESMTQAYMRGDLKPVGSTGALLPVLALFDDEGFRASLSA